MDERKFKRFISNYMHQETENMKKNTISIFALGFVCGLILSYSQFLHIVIGFAAGTFCSHKGIRDFSTIHIISPTSSILRRGMEIMYEFNKSNAVNKGEEEEEDSSLDEKKIH